MGECWQMVSALDHSQRQGPGAVNPLLITGCLGIYSVWGVDKQRRGAAGAEAGACLLGGGGVAVFLGDTQV